MSRGGGGQNNNGRGGGRGGWNTGGRGGNGGSVSGSQRGQGRGSWRGGWGRGRGRGGAMLDQSAVALDYNQLDMMDPSQLGFTPSPSYSYTPRSSAPTPPNYNTNHNHNNTRNNNNNSNNGSPSGSGYNTPRRGLARGRGGGDLVPRGGRGGGVRGGANQPRGGGLGFHTAPPAPHQSWGDGGRGYGDTGPRPLLVPVKFVKAQGITSATSDLEGDPVPGELADKVPATSSLVVDEEHTLEPDFGTAEVEAETSFSKEPASSWAVDTTPSQSPANTTARSTVQIPKGFVLGLTPNPPARTEVISDDEDEQIVYPPTANQTTTSVPEQSPSDPLSPCSAPPSSRGAITTPSSPTLDPTILSSLPSQISLPGLPTAPGSPIRPLSSMASLSKALFEPLSSIQTPTASSLKKKPQPKLTKGQKKALKAAGKKARKAGKQHARSGNRHLFVAGDDDDEDDSGEDEEIDEQDMKDGDEMLSRILGVETMTLDEGSEEEEEDGTEQELKAREGDSDLDWGEQGPPPGPPSRKAKKDKRNAQRAESRESERLDRISVDQREQVVAALGGRVTSITREEEIVVRVSGKGKGKKKTAAELALEDYEQNVLNRQSDSEAEDRSSAANSKDLQFLLGLVDASKSSFHQSIADLEDEADAAKEDDEDEGGWNTTDSEGVDSGDELEMDHALGEADAAVELALAQEEEEMMGEEDGDDFDSSEPSEDEDAAVEELLAGGTVRFSSMGKAGPGGRRSKAERKKRKKGKGKWVEGDSEDDEDDDMFLGQDNWAEEDEDDDYVRGLEAMIEENAELLLNSRDRKQRKKLFKAIIDGDFEMDDDDMVPSSSKGPRIKPNDNFASDLQAQWEKDRAKKGAYKRARAEARAAAQEASPHIRTKKGYRPPAPLEGGSDASAYNLAMREFVMDPTKETLALPPMSKKSRVAVHLLAEVYGLKSKSVGKGSSRFPVLEKTKRSAVFGVDERKVRAIVHTAAGEGAGRWNSGGGLNKGKMGGLWAALSGEKPSSSGQRGGGAKHREGVVVGVGAEKIGSDNVGFALLQKMGWKEGDQIGMSGGISEPIAARIKTNRSGLGSGYSISRTEAASFAVSATSSSNGW